MKIAVIPARGGSKRILRKNIKNFCGKPMIAWSIEAAKTSGCFDQIIVSTDDHEIAEIAQEWGCDVPFMRPANLADDYASTPDVMQHAATWLNSQENKPSFICCISATAPLIDSHYLQAGLKKIEHEKCDYAISVTSYPSPIQRAFRITNEERIEMFYPENFHKRSQELEEAYHDAGQFYWGKTSAWLTKKLLFSHEAVPIQLPMIQVQDIDTHEDWELAELKYKILLNGST
ncbi:MAG: pseudaminic acid cytidylyltransferase [Gammaproteobacteria bacterium]|nr:pseudaminic acid cytidylyltransferase [Gammaproteobacteria bacterium]